MKQFSIALSLLFMVTILLSQNQPGLHIADNHTVVFGIDTISGGDKVLWYPSKAAFRAGRTSTTEWIQENVGVFSTAFGSGTEARGSYSAAFGLGTWALSFAETSVGRYSLGGGNLNSWLPTDPLFEVGNGLSPNARSNAMTVFKNGNTEIQSSVKVGEHQGANPAAGTIQYNSTTQDYEGWDNQHNEWKSLTSGPTTIGNYGTVVNPVTGKVWLDRNLGASRVATSSTDAASYGDLYQWGRAAEGHQLRTSGISIQEANTFIAESGSWSGQYILVFQWLSTAETHMWSGTEAENNPCPSGFRIPTNAEWVQEKATWSSNDAAGAFASPLKLPKGGFRGGEFAELLSVGIGGYYWSSTANTDAFTSRHLFFDDSSAHMDNEFRGFGLCVRCIKD
jgi:uncharacterized protein (TIGR02145 family)